MSDRDDDGILGVDDDFGMDSDDEDVPGSNQEVLNLDAGPSDDDEPMPGNSGDGGFPDPDKKFNGAVGDTEKVENQPFDEAVEINDSEEVDSDDDDDEAFGKNMGANNDGYPEDVGDVQQEQIDLPGQYNPNDYANLNVDDDVKELFEYIGRFKPQTIQLESKFKPFIPDYIPAVGEVDAFLKMKKPSGDDEELGITVLDEPSLNHIDDKVLEMKYIQLKKTLTVQPTAMSVKSVECAEKNHKEVTNWINNVTELHKGRPPPTVNYTKQMPDFDLLMEEWPQGMERAMREIDFPGPDIALSTEDYSKVMLALLGIPNHKHDKGIIEGLHTMFTLYSVFKENEHIKQLGKQ